MKGTIEILPFVRRFWRPSYNLQLYIATLQFHNEHRSIYPLARKVFKIRLWSYLGKALYKEMQSLYNKEMCKLVLFYPHKGHI